MSTATASSFGALLKRQRIVAGVTQEELAEQAGMSLRGLGALENGERIRPHKETVRMLADALQLGGREREAFEAAARGQRDTGRRTEIATEAVWPATYARGWVDVETLDASPLPLVGRARELELLEWHLAGQGARVLVLAGEPGIGKTRLLQHATRRAWQLGATVLTGGCQRRSLREPYAPFPRALAQPLATLSAPQLGEILRECNWLVRLLPEFGTSQGAPTPLGGASPEQERRLVFGAVGRLLANLGGPAGTVLVLDDLQWAPVDALDLLTAVLHDPAACGLRVVCAYRNSDVRPEDPLAVTLADLAHAGLARQHTVDRLSEHEARQLLESLIEEPQRGTATAARALRLTGGVPFYLVSYAQELRLHPDATLPAEGVPWNVTHSIRQRVAALPRTAQEVLSAASLVGEVAPYALLHAVMARPEEELVAALDAACEARLLLEYGDRAYQFSHDVIREVVEGNLGAGRRTLLHRRVGEGLEQLLGRERERRAGELAWHYLQGAAPARALPYLILAGDRAELAFAHVEAERQYRLALQVAHEVVDCRHEVELQQRLGRVLTLTGHYEEGLDLLHRAADGYRNGDDLDGEARVTAQIMYAHESSGMCQAGLHSAEVLERRLREAAPSPGIVLFYSALVNYLRLLGRYDEQLTAAQRAVELARSLGDEAVLARAVARLGFTLAMLDHDDQARAALQEAIPLLERHGDFVELIRAYHNLAGLYWVQGDLATARGLWQQAAEVAERLGEPARISVQTSVLGMFAVESGEWQEGRRLLERALAAASRAEAAYVTQRPLYGLGWLSLIEGRFDEAADHIARLQKLAGESGYPSARLDAQLLLLYRDLLEGRPDRAVARMDASYVATQAELHIRPIYLAYIAEAHLELGHDKLAEELLHVRLDQSERADSRYMMVEPMLVRAKLLVHQGRWKDATDRLEELLDFVSFSPYAHARTLYEYGRMHLQRGEPRKARERLEEALAILRRLGARPYIERTEQALQTLVRSC